MLFISPPFGNYINLPHTISIKGSFTLEKRDGLFLQILKTLRYSYVYKGWINKIGLRNKGIDSIVNNYDKNSIYSIAILNKNEIKKIQEKIPNDMNIEINISCPNVEKENDFDLKDFLNIKRNWCIIKLSPTVDHKLIDKYYKQGFRQFHCSNTIPIKEGGLSGNSIIPYNNKLVKHIKEHYKDSIIICGGGIQTINDLDNYRKIGASHFSVSTLLFNPIKFLIFYSKYINKI